VPYPSESFGSLSAPFQWTDPPESQTVVFTGTRKPEVPENQNQYQSRFPQVNFQGAKLQIFEL
jgi:hypothetical protein